MSFRVVTLSAVQKPAQTAMGNELQVRLHMYTLIVFILLCPRILRCSSDIDHSNDLDSTVSLQCSQRYLSKLYFENHDSLIDTDFQDFWAHELPVCSCNALPQNLDYAPRLSVLQRQLNGEGSHRHLSTFIKFHIQSEGTYELPAHLCQVIVVEKLPSGVFADPFELQHLVQRGVLIDAAVFGDTNLELPSALSNRSVVEVHMDIGQNILLGNKKALEIKFDLPLHARYPPLSGSGYAVVEMGVPDIFMRYITREKPQANNCVSITRVEIADTNTTPVVWRVPSGNKEHSGLVSAATFTSALLSTLFIVISAIYSSNAHFSYSTKQS